MKERLQKVMAQAGIGSRRACEEIIVQERVLVNGEIAVLGTKVDPKTDHILVDGEVLGSRQELRYLILNKPLGYITTVGDQFGRKDVLDLLAGVQERVYPVGRLDYDSEGLVFVTNDGALAYRVMHPKFGLPKSYLVEVEGQVTKEAIRILEKGVALKDGLTYPAQVQVMKKDNRISLLSLTIREGRNRQIRRMAQKVGFPVRHLLRTAIGPLQLGQLASGDFRDLTSREINELKQAAQKGKLL